MPSDQGFVSAPHRQKSHEMRQADSRGSEGVEGMSVPAVLRRATSNGQVSVTLRTDPRLRRGQKLNSEWVTTQGGLSLHRRLAIEAAEEQVSINQLVIRRFQNSGHGEVFHLVAGWLLML